MDKRSFVWGVVFATLTMLIVGYGIAQVTDLGKNKLPAGSEVAIGIRYGGLTQEQANTLVDEADWAAASQQTWQDGVLGFKRCYEQRDLGTMQDVVTLIDKGCPKSTTTTTLQLEPFKIPGT